MCIEGGEWASEVGLNWSLILRAELEGEEAQPPTSKRRATLLVGWIVELAQIDSTSLFVFHQFQAGFQSLYSAHEQRDE